MADELHPSTEKRMEENIRKAKEKVITTYEHSKVTWRKWLEASLDSYRTADHRITIFALEGSPVKGYVIANFGTEKVIAFGNDDKKLKTYHVYEHGVL